MPRVGWYNFNKKDFGYVKLRTFKTTKPIKGIVRKPETEHLNPVERAIKEQDDLDMY